MVSRKENNNTKRITHRKNADNIINMTDYSAKRNVIIDSIKHARKAMLPKQPKTYSPEDIIVWRYRTHSNISTYDKNSAVRSFLGAVCVIVGVSTLWLPSGSMLLIGLGCGLLGYDVKGLISRVKYEINLFKLRGFNLWE
jgi:hypothetical protein